MKKTLSIILCFILVVGIYTVPVSAHVDTRETIFDFNDLSADENGIFVNTDTSKYTVYGRTQYVNDSTAYNEVYVTNEGNGDKAVTLKSTKNAKFAYSVSGFNYSGTVEIGFTLKIDDLYSRRYFGCYDCWSNSKWLLMVHSNGYMYVAGIGLSNKAAAGDILDCKYYVDLATGYTHAIIKKNGANWIDMTNTNNNFKNLALNRLCLYQIDYTNTSLTPSVSHFDDLYIKPTNRFYDKVSKSYDFNTFVGSNDGYTTMPEDFTRAYGTKYTDGTAVYEGIFSIETSRGKSVKAESNKPRNGGGGDAPYISTTTSVLSTETGLLEISVMRPEKPASLYINLGAYSMPLMLIAAQNGNIQVFNKDIGIALSDTNKWYDIKVLYNTADLTAYIEVYRGETLVGRKFIQQTDETKNAYKNVKGQSVTKIGFGLYLWDTINANSGDVSSIIFDDIKLDKSEKLYFPSENYEAFDIAYSSPITATKVPAGNDVKVTFNNPINTSSFTSSTVSVNGVAVSNGQISFDEDGHTVVLSGVATNPDSHYHVAFASVKDTSGNTLTDYIEFNTSLPDMVMSDVKFYRGTGADEYVYAVTEPGVINASFTAYTNNGCVVDMVYYLALYKEDSDCPQLVALSSDTLNITGPVRTYTLSVTVPDDGHMYTLKALRLDRTDMSPFSKAAMLRDINDQEVPIAIIKFDDLSVSALSSFENWQQYAEENNIHLNFGLLCNSFDSDEDTDSINRLSAINNSSNVEIWLHGYDHAGGSGITSEFREDHASQAQTFDDCARVSNKAGITFKSFNPGYNELNEDTANLLEQKGYTAAMLISNSVSDYMLNKNFVTLYNDNSLELNASVSNTDRVSSMEQFTAKYSELAALAEASDKNYILYQGHPAQWNETSNKKFIEIVEYLKSIGTAFMEPADYARLMK